MLNGHLIGAQFSSKVGQVPTTTTQQQPLAVSISAVGSPDVSVGPSPAHAPIIILQHDSPDNNKETSSGYEKALNNLDHIPTMAEIVELKAFYNGGGGGGDGDQTARSGGGGDGDGDQTARSGGDGDGDGDGDQTARSGGGGGGGDGDQTARSGGVGSEETKAVEEDDASAEEIRKPAQPLPASESS